MTGAWTLSHGLPNSLRPDAAQLYWHAFGPKLGRVLGPDRRALAFLENVIRADHVLIATAQDGSLLGLAGFKTPKGSFAMGNPQALRQFYGPWGGLWRNLLLGLLSSEVDNDNFLIDGICVAPKRGGKASARPCCTPCVIKPKRSVTAECGWMSLPRTPLRKGFTAARALCKPSSTT